MFRTPPNSFVQGHNNNNVTHNVQQQNATMNVGLSPGHVSSSIDDLLGFDNNSGVLEPRNIQVPIHNVSSHHRGEPLNIHPPNASIHYQNNNFPISTHAYQDSVPPPYSSIPCQNNAIPFQSNNFQRQTTSTPENPQIDFLVKELERCKLVIQNLTHQVESQKKQPNFSNGNKRFVTPPTQNDQFKYNINSNQRNRHTESEKSVLDSDTEVSSSEEYQKPSYKPSHEFPRRSQINSNTLNQKFKCEMKSWPIRFSKGDGKQFWSNVENFQELYGYEDKIVFKYFHQLLEGHAVQWYIQFCAEYKHSNLSQLKAEFCRNFKSTETDVALISTMYAHKQGRDSFEKFYNEIIDKNFTLKNPLSNEQIIEILKSNMDDEVRQRIFTFETTDRVAFFHKANKAYLDVCQTRERRKNFYDNKFSRKINELDFEDLSFNEIEVISSKVNTWKSKRSCFNCHSDKHFLPNCPEDITRFFCFKCGKEGYATPKCPTCNLNQRRSGE